MKIILVGNGEGKEKNGEKIDDFDLVVRFNEFKIQGYEDYIGFKTNIVVGYKHKNVKLYDGVDELLMITEKQDYIFPVELEKKIHYLDKIFLENLIKEYKTKSKKNGAYPTSGYRAIKYFLKEYPDDDLYLVGFDFFKTKHYFNSNHIHWEKHDSQYEEEYVNVLLMNKKIKLLNND